MRAGRPHCPLCCHPSCRDAPCCSCRRSGRSGHSQSRNASRGPVLSPLCVSCSLLAATHLSHPLVGLVGEDPLAFLLPEGRVGLVAASVALSAALPPAALLRAEPLIAALRQEARLALLAGPLVVGDRVVGHLGPHHMRVKAGGDSEPVSDP